MIQALFPRLKEPLLFEEDGDRFIILRLMVNLYNYQTERMGATQIFNSFANDETDFFDNMDEFYDLEGEV